MVLELRSVLAVLAGGRYIAPAATVMQPRPLPLQRAAARDNHKCAVSVTDAEADGLAQRALGITIQLLNAARLIRVPVIYSIRH